jgi:hypothetical protein
MPDTEGRLFAADVAAELGITASDWRARVSRGHAPASDSYVVHDGRARAVWKRETIDQHLNRPARRGPASNGVEQG